jgi:hypothetical protein
MKENNYICMGDCGRFPNKKVKDTITMKRKIINMFLWFNFKRKRKSIWKL